MAKSKWDEVEEKLMLVEAWARDGLTDEQIMAKLGISKPTFYDYVKRYPNFSNALKRGKEIVDVQVENALLKRALGYKYEEVTKELVPKTDENGDYVKDAAGAIIRVLEVTKVVTKEEKPDTTAQIFWLKNRKRAEWRDKQDIDVSGNIGVKKLEDFF